jgi:hypothetical protein
MQKIALSDRTFAYHFIMHVNSDPIPSTKRIKVAPTKMRERDFVTVIYVEQDPIFAFADNVPLLGVIGHQPVQCTQRYPALLIHEGNEYIVDHVVGKKGYDSLHDAHLPLGHICALKRPNHFRISLQ